MESRSVRSRQKVGGTAERPKIEDTVRVPNPVAKALVKVFLALTLILPSALLLPAYPSPAHAATVVAVSPPAKATVTGITADDVLNVRDAPSMQGAVVGRMSNGTKMEVTGYTSDGWLRTNYDGRKGVFVFSEFVQVPVVSVSVGKSAVTVKTGTTTATGHSIFPPCATNTKVTWSSSKTSVATVDTSGKVKALAPGTTTVTVKSADGGKTAKCTYTVIRPVTGVNLNKKTSTLAAGKTETLKPAVSPTDASDKTVTWKSNKPGVAAVDSAGKVTAKAAGTATVTATTRDGGKTATCTYTVTQPVTGVTLDKATSALVVGKSETLRATVAPANATVKTVSWTSDNASVAVVDSAGKVTAKAAGKATVTVTTKEGNKTARCAYTVTDAPVAVTGVTLDKATSTLPVGGSEALVAAVAPPGATNRIVEWISDKPAVASVDTSGKVTALSPGTAIITVKTADGAKTASCTYTIVRPASGVTLDKATSTLVVGTSEVLKAVVTPEDAADKSVSWSSGDPAIVAVDAGGKVTALASGVAAITATTTDGGYTASCTYTVTDTPVPVTGVTLDKDVSTLETDGTETLKATVEPDGATDKSLSWTSDRPAVASVDADGRVAALSPGTATVTVTTTDGGHAASCTYTVVRPVAGISLNKTSLPLITGRTETLTETVSPPDATDKTVTWTSGDPKIASVDAGRVTARSQGTTVITATTRDKGRTATCAVTVMPVPVAVISVALSKTTETMYAKGPTLRLTASVKPPGATDKSVVWTSSKTNIATVDASGTVTAKAKGAAVITVTTADGKKTAKCKITVKEASKLKLSKKTTIPNSLPQNTKVSLTGTVTSNYAITSVRAQIRTEAGKVLHGTSHTVAATKRMKSYDTKVLAARLAFHELAPGSYTYTLTAKDETGPEKVLQKKSFKVVSVISVPKERIIPETFVRGTAVTLAGKVSSTVRLTEVTLAIKDSEGVACRTKTLHLNKKKSCKLAELEKLKAFDGLKTGVYTLSVTVKDSSSNSKTLPTRKFTILSNLRLDKPTEIPWEITQGKGITLKGVVRSEYALVSVRAEIRTVGAKKLHWAQKNQKELGGARSYNTGKEEFKKLLKFDKLKPGEYTYTVFAKDKSDTAERELRKWSFTVVSSVEAFVELALKQDGYQAREYNNGSPNDGWTKFSEPFGLQGYPWCAMFVSWCAFYGPEKVKTNIPVSSASVWAFRTEYERLGRFKARSSRYTPERGDLLMYTEDSHIGIVTGCSNGIVHTIEGNTGNGIVAERQYYLDDSRIAGYGIGN